MSNSRETIMKMTTKIPPEITTPDSVETSLGTLRFFDGLPTRTPSRKFMTTLTACVASMCS